MKIIEHGKHHARDEMRFKCSYCGCIFETDRYGRYERLFYDHFSNRFTVVTGHISKCPECGEEVYEVSKRETNA